MNAVIEDALDLWGLVGARCTLIAARENAVHRIDAGNRTLALRVHRKGYRTDRELRSELQWMQAAAQGGLNVPTPIPSLQGALLHRINGQQVDALSWLGGVPLADCVDAFSAQRRAEVFGLLGRQMARLHQISDDWAAPEGFQRCSWDRKGLLGDRPLWDRFWENPTLSKEDKELFLTLRDAARDALAKCKDHLDFGLIHADLVAANVLVETDAAHFIDFDDGGFGYRIFEIATTLLKFMEAPDYADLRDALIRGYRSKRRLDTSPLDLFLALRAASYVGWNIARMNEPDGAARNVRFVNTARRLATDYLAGS